MLMVSMREKNWLFIASIRGENQEQNWLVKEKELERFRWLKREQKKRQQLSKNLDTTEMDGKGVEKDGCLATAAKSTKQSTKKCLSQE
jgi:CDP-glycerol glycerophosphotransferase (TagB/SpsB family)